MENINTRAIYKVELNRPRYLVNLDPLPAKLTQLKKVPAKNDRAVGRVTSEQLFLKEIIQHKGYSLSRIAVELEVSKSTVSRLLNGLVKQTNNTIFAKLLRLYCRIFYDKNGVRKVLE